MYNFCLSRKVKFSDFNSKSIKFENLNFGTTIIKDGNYLRLKIQKNDRYITLRWFVRIPIKNAETGKPSARNFLIGCWSKISQDEARIQTHKVIESIKISNQFPTETVKNKLFTAFTDEGDEVEYTNHFSPHKKNVLSDEDVKKIRATDNHKGKREIMVRPNLNLVIREGKNTTTRIYQLIFRNKFDKKSTVIPLGDANQISIESAMKIREYLNIKIALYKAGSKRIYIQKALEEYFDSARNLSSDEVEIQNRVLDNSKIVYVTKSAIESLFSNLIKINSDFLPSDDDAKKYGSLTWYKVFNEWYDYWSGNVTENTKNEVKRNVVRFTQQVFYLPIEKILDKRLFNEIILALNKINQNSASILLKILVRILNYAQALNYINSNPLEPLKSIIKRKKSVPRLSLSPFNLQAEIHLLFKSYISKMQTKYRIIFELLFYTLLRSNELLKIKKCQLNFLDDTPRLDTYLNKTLKEFSIPLTDYAVNLVKLLVKIDTSESVYLFSNLNKNKNNRIHGARLANKLKEMNCNMIVPHGIRSVGAAFFSQNIKEIPYQVGMACLQHNYTTSVHLVYDRTFLYEPRKEAMKLWSNFLEDSIGEFSVLKQCL